MLMYINGLEKKKTSLERKKLITRMNTVCMLEYLLCATYISIQTPGFHISAHSRTPSDRSITIAVINNSKNPSVSTAHTNSI